MRKQEVFPKESTIWMACQGVEGWGGWTILHRGGITSTSAFEGTAGAGILLRHSYLVVTDMKMVSGSLSEFPIVSYVCRITTVSNWTYNLSTLFVLSFSFLLSWKILGKCPPEKNEVGMLFPLLTIQCGYLGIASASTSSHLDLMLTL